MRPSNRLWLRLQSETEFCRGWERPSGIKDDIVRLFPNGGRQISSRVCVAVAEPVVAGECLDQRSRASNIIISTVGQVRGKHVQERVQKI